MNKKYAAVFLAATALLLLAEVFGFAVTAYGQGSGQGQSAVTGKASIKIVTPESSEAPSSSGSGRSSNNGRNNSRDNDDGGGVRGGGTTVVIENEPVPAGTVTIVDPNVPLQDMPELPKTGGNGAGTALSLFLITAGAATLRLSRVNRRAARGRQPSVFS